MNFLKHNQRYGPTCRFYAQLIHKPAGATRLVMSGLIVKHCQQSLGACFSSLNKPPQLSGELTCNSSHLL
jgi:hypothetical protein